MIAILTKEVENAILYFQSEIDTIIDNANANLINLRDSKKLSNPEQAFVIKIINYDIKKLIYAKPDELKTCKLAIGKIPKNTRVKPKKSFKDELLDCFDYSGIRSYFYPKYFQRIGIKACVYCNSQLTVTTESSKVSKKYYKKNTPKIKAKFQVDHYHPKSDYPYLSISFFNLYPVCASCNNSKSNYPVSFDLYSNNPVKCRKSNFHFKFCKGSVADYKLSRNIDDIKFIFIEPATKNHRFQKIFDIQGIYDTQKDIAEELITKSEIYTKSYKDSLIISFGEILNNTNISNRIITGNYMEPENIHKRPMAKFMQDLAHQLGLPIK